MRPSPPYGSALHPGLCLSFPHPPEGILPTGDNSYSPSARLSALSTTPLKKAAWNFHPPADHSPTLSLSVRPSTQAAHVQTVGRGWTLQRLQRGYRTPTHRSPPWCAACLAWGSQRPGNGASLCSPQHGRCRTCQRGRHPRTGQCCRGGASLTPASSLGSATAHVVAAGGCEASRGRAREHLPSRRAQGGRACGLGRSGRAYDRPNSLRTQGAGPVD